MSPMRSEIEAPRPQRAATAPAAGAARGACARASVRDRRLRTTRAGRHRCPPGAAGARPDRGRSPRSTSRPDIWTSVTYPGSFPRAEGGVRWSDSWRSVRLGHTSNDPHLLPPYQLFGFVPSRLPRGAAFARPRGFTAATAGSEPSARRAQSEAEQARPLSSCGRRSTASSASTTLRSASSTAASTAPPRRSRASASTRSPSLPSSSAT